jgi:hypothetical protein
VGATGKRLLASACRGPGRTEALPRRTGRGVGGILRHDLQYLAGGGPLSERLVALGLALGKLTLEIRYEPLGIG